MKEGRREGVIEWRNKEGRTSRMKELGEGRRDGGKAEGESMEGLMDGMRDREGQ